MTKDRVRQLAEQYALQVGPKSDLGDVADTVYDAILAALDEHEQDIARQCEQHVERDAEYGGRFGGYGNFMGSKTGIECASEIRAMSAVRRAALKEGM